MIRIENITFLENISYSSNDIFFENSKGNDSGKNYKIGTFSLSYFKEIINSNRFPYIVEFSKFEIDDNMIEYLNQFKNIEIDIEEIFLEVFRFIDFSDKTVVFSKKFDFALDSDFFNIFGFFEYENYYIREYKDRLVDTRFLQNKNTFKS